MKKTDMEAKLANFDAQKGALETQIAFHKNEIARLKNELEALSHERTAYEIREGIYVSPTEKATAGAKDVFNKAVVGVDKGIHVASKKTRDLVKNFVKSLESDEGAPVEELVDGKAEVPEIPVETEEVVEADAPEVVDIEKEAE